MNEIKVSSKEILLEHNSYFIFISDGFEERVNNNNVFWGIDNFEKSLQKYCLYNSSADEMISQIFTDCDQFAAGRKNIDDMTIVVLHWK
jgi:serine phosphatase RsbU (regulator of sigma subunit)